MSQGFKTQPLSWKAPLAEAGVREQRLRLLHRLGIDRVSDLVRHLPLRYEQQEAETPVGQLVVETIGAARGLVTAARWVPRMGRGKPRFEARLEDESGRLQLVWFHARYLREKLHPGMTIRVHGKVEVYRENPQMINPQWEVLEDLAQAPIKEERLRPVYPATEDLSSRVIEGLVEQVLPRVQGEIVDPLPPRYLERRAMPALADAYRMMHLPRDGDEPGAGRRRLAYNELLLLQLGIALKRRYNRVELSAPALRWNAAIDRHIRDRFGFELTDAQTKVIREIAADLQQAQPMNRLLQGDVGSGKTVVALYALLMAVADQHQGALMAPTELLAEQHYASIAEMLAGSNVRIELLTGGRTTAGSAERRAQLARIAEGEVDLVIGTQALLTEHVRFARLAVVVVDEQHRFGVLQRAAFRQSRKREESKVQSPKSKTRSKDKDDGKRFSPHYLVMTATPIPRTLSLTVFGDLDVSTIKGMPPGRTPIATRVVGPSQSDEVYRYVAQRVAAGEQAYVVVPLIDEQGMESAAQLKGVRAHAKFLQETYFSAGGEREKGHVAAVHGKLKHRTRQAIMDRFRRGEIQVLVATTVIEVGVDVPNATLMVVEHAERFGLAQLHQLRGRIGRGTDGKKSVCAFIAEPTTQEAEARMKAIGGTTDGFRIAEEDLEIRGMGDFFGTRQHGLPPLRVAKIPGDMDLLQMTRRDAKGIVDKDPKLADPKWRLLRRAVLQQYGQTLGLIDVG